MMREFAGSHWLELLARISLIIFVVLSLLSAGRSAASRAFRSEVARWAGHARHGKRYSYTPVQLLAVINNRTQHSVHDSVVVQLHRFTLAQNFI